MLPCAHAGHHRPSCLGVAAAKDTRVEQDSQLLFGPFRFDQTRQRLWQGPRDMRIRAKTLAVLQYLLASPGRVIPRQEFAQHVWGQTHVTRSVLRVCIWELRQALGDVGPTPQYIETVGQQGYRWCAPTRQTGAAARPEVPFVGRQAELAALHTALDQAQRGTGHLVFVTGDPGIGKTTLVHQFLSQVATPTPLWIGRGQCVEHVGDGEAYLPFLDALGRLGQAPEGTPLLPVLRHTAPMWLAHLPPLVAPGELDALRGRVQRMPPARMLRECVEALTVVTQERVVVLVLEDLQWSDTATVELLAYLARRPERSRLLVLGTYRPAEVIARWHPLRQTVQELVAHRLCQELQLELLTSEQIEDYVCARLGPGPAPTVLGTLLYQRTDGNALFVVRLLDHLLQQGWLVAADGQWRLREGTAGVAQTVPNGLRALLLKQVEALSGPAQQVLDAASVSGRAFTTAAVAAALQRPVEEVEALCDGLTQQSTFLTAQEFRTWPDGTVTAGYAFRHALYRSVLYERLGMARRGRWHRRVAERIEAGYGSRARELAGELALHFERGQDVRRAAQYRQYAAEQALCLSAYTEALAHCRQGLALLATLPASPERSNQELTLRLALNIALELTHGQASEELAHNLLQALALCEAVEATTALVPVLVALTRQSMLRADRVATERLMARERGLLQQLHDPASLVQLHMQLGTAETLRGAFAQAEEHHKHVLRLYDAAAHQPSVLTLGSDPSVGALAVPALRLWLTGWPDQAVEYAVRAQARAETLGPLLSLMVALTSSVQIRLLRGECTAAFALAQRLVDMGHEYDFVLYEAMGTMFQGSVWGQDGGLDRGLTLLTTGLARYRHLGSAASVPFFLTFLAQAHLQLGQVEEGLAVIKEAVQLTETSFVRFWTAEVYRLQGELLLAQAGQARPAIGPETATAEACFQQALNIAQQQGAKALELRAAISLSRVWLAQDKPAAAHALVARCYDEFSEGFDTVDLQTAKSLLARCQPMT
jgi:DNA-binding winged helix-turn-helix (wHTH) protein/predicted ATPase